MPEEGLSLAYINNANDSLITKAFSGASVTINGIVAKETSIPGVYACNVSTVFPIMLLLVSAQSENIATTVAFSTTHSSNQIMWFISVGAIASLLLIAVFAGSKIRGKKITTFFSKDNYPLLGGICLLLVSAINLYWGSIAIEAHFHGFDAMFFAILEIGFTVPLLISCALSIKRRRLVWVIFSASTPTLTVLGVKLWLDMYQLPTPYLALFATLSITFAAVYFITNAKSYPADK